ncbi:MAG: TonB-dependent receptor plug domain-containing protein, partial [Deltaproteobacteria bacterium]|nr:TonB-dependent receptor plug domain-containing protein [Deltaproteobacteria bacterium]
MKKGFIIALALLASTFALMPQAAAQTEAREGQVQDLGQIQVTAEGEKEAFTLSPSATILDLDDYQTIEIPQNVGDIMRDLVIFDFRGETDLVPGIDSFQMRGFNGDRFVTAIDGLTLRKTGGRKSSNIVDYAYLPPFLIEKMEVLPGPHSALYPAKSIGGVVNFISRAPKIHETLKPDISASSSIGT